jgi:hypothetical protein
MTDAVEQSPSEAKSIPTTDIEPLKVPESMVFSKGPDQVAFILESDSMAPLRNFLYMVYVAILPEFQNDFLEISGKLFLGKIEPTQFIDFVRRNSTFDSVDDALIERIGAYVSYIHKTKTKIQKLDFICALNVLKKRLANEEYDLPIEYKNAELGRVLSVDIAQGVEVKDKDAMMTVINKLHELEVNTQAGFDSCNIKFSQNEIDLLERPLFQDILCFYGKESIIDDAKARLKLQFAIRSSMLFFNLSQSKSSTANAADLSFLEEDDTDAATLSSEMTC